MSEARRKPGAAMAVFSMCSILQKCMPFVLMPFLTRLLSLEEYGIYSTYTAWLTIFASVCTLNLHLGVFNNGMHRFAKDRERYASSMVWITALPAASLYLWRADAQGVILTTVFVQAVFGSVCAAELLLRGRGRAKGSYIRYAVWFNLALIPHYLSGVILGQVDRTMINAMCGAAQTAVYSVAHTFALALNFAVSSVNAAIVPWTYETVAERKLKELNRIITILAGGFAALLLVSVLVMPEIMKLFITREYYGAIRLVPPIAVSSFFIFLYNLFANVEFYFEAKYFISVSSVLAAVLNVALNYIFIAEYGYTAAAYTTGICYALYALFHFMNVRRLGKKYLPGKELYPMKFLAALALVLGAGVPALLAVYEKAAVRYALLAGLSAAAFFRRREIFRAVKYVFAGEKE